MKKLYKVATKIDVTYEYLNLFRKIKKVENAHFTHTARIIYANSAKEAIEKYTKLFFVDLPDVVLFIKELGLICNEKSDNMKFYKPFNSRLKSIGYVSIREIDYQCKDIGTLTKYMPANDFRDWWYDGKSSECKCNNKSKNIKKSK